MLEVPTAVTSLSTGTAGVYLGLRTLLSEVPAGRARCSVQLFSSPAGGGGLGGVPLDVAEFGDGVGERGETGDQGNLGEGAVVAGERAVRLRLKSPVASSAEAAVVAAAGCSVLGWPRESARARAQRSSSGWRRSPRTTAPVTTALRQLMKAVREGYGTPSQSPLGDIPGLTATGAAAILAETGDPKRYDTSSSVVKHAGLSPSDNASGAFDGEAHISRRGPACA